MTDTEMGSLEDREEVIKEMNNYLTVATIGELYWIKRKLFRDLKPRFEKELTKAENVFENYKKKAEKLQNKQDNFINEINKLHEKDLLNESQKNELTTNIKKLQDDKMELSVENITLKGELERIGVIYENLTGKDPSNTDLAELLGIYITLIDNVFSGRVHFKILALLHGDKKEWKREEIVKTTVINEIEVRKSLGELSRTNLIEYDEETTKVKLKKKIENLF